MLPPTAMPRTHRSLPAAGVLQWAAVSNALIPPPQLATSPLSARRLPPPASQRQTAKWMLAAVQPSHRSVPIACRKQVQQQPFVQGPGRSCRLATRRPLLARAAAASSAPGAQAVGKAACGGSIERCTAGTAAVSLDHNSKQGVCAPTLMKSSGSSPYFSATLSLASLTTEGSCGIDVCTGCMLSGREVTAAVHSAACQLCAVNKS